MADPRTTLPEGNWDVGYTEVRPPNHAKSDTSFWVVGKDRVSGDQVGAYVVVGDLGCDYSLEDWGLPADLSRGRVLHLARIDPRVERARGGTTAIIRYLAEFADRCGAWLTTEVKTDDDARDAIVMALLTKHGDFVSPDAEYAARMIRQPRAST